MDQEWFWDYRILSIIAVVIISLLIVFLFRSKKKRYDVRKITMNDIDRMTGYEFEHYLYVMFASIGFDHTSITKSSRDFGADLTFTDLDGEKVVVQAKRLSDKLGLDAVQEVYAAKAYYAADVALVMTNTDRVSLPCRKLASATGVKIISRDQLHKFVYEGKKGRINEVQEIMNQADEHVVYCSDESIERIEHSRGMIEAGDYYVKL
ncbi:restriction endonuclease [Halalkalibacter sp. APA_J-10(15)]|uniref:restriction endonuclease n=1 Tax=Halalkalibacter sp. APA_J-10(15) TaxID=2933805 RepID=UPI001FF2DDEB|nr:restriction endonuclease [Halalkalibacter sp. APA_J-10(15)]MCK0471241.1 restriction endonuclease [Halalkalibacter sp. APA_J-10(15)]